jgi:hypothetical protein
MTSPGIVFVAGLHRCCGQIRPPVGGKRIGLVDVEHHSIGGAGCRSDARGAWAEFGHIAHTSEADASTPTAARLVCPYALFSSRRQYLVGFLLVNAQGRPENRRRHRDPPPASRPCVHEGLTAQSCAGSHRFVWRCTARQQRNASRQPIVRSRGAKVRFIFGSQVPCHRCFRAAFLTDLTPFIDCAQPREIRWTTGSLGLGRRSAPGMTCPLGRGLPGR